MPDRPVLHHLSPAGRPADGYGQNLVDALAAAGWRVAETALPGAYPRVDQSAILAADIALSRLPDGAWVLVDGLALPGLAGGIALDSRRLRFVALVEQPLWRDPGLAADEAAALRNLEQGALALMRRVLVPSPAVAAEMAALGLPGNMVAVVSPDGDGALRLAALLDA
ncbi:glycosyl transferase [Azospirillum rugosum]|uniref:Glycosyl transferase n=1 Tax=Azospirillum rugosum TaxID=416170 RepID=A0ABS4SMY7_9PROT|nr:glycosyl transferase [Azospirillum rugosum]MBP2293900.1 hypothetical protein [Azospirillum rugosum]MDQ0526913.1 hypothetical protein [Azospirillum rugosum]